MELVLVVVVVVVVVVDTGKHDVSVPCWTVNGPVYRRKNPSASANRGGIGGAIAERSDHQRPSVPSSRLFDCNRDQTDPRRKNRPMNP